MQIERGTVFGHRYVVQSQIGTGGMATVYRGIDQTLDRLVAIKVMLERYASDPTFAARFKQEAQAAAALSSPYIVGIYDWGREGDTYYIVMEYLRGTDLKTGIRSHGPLDPLKVAQIGAQVCQALTVAHEHDIIHRDIKPQNIMIQPSGDAKVMDFGIARSKNSHLTQTNSVLGTAHYVSPEQAQGKELGPTSDLYSLGIVMYEAATGKLPFDGNDAVSVALKQVNEEPVPANEVNPDVDDDLNAIIMKCMEKNPAARFQTANELRRALNGYIRSRSTAMEGATTTLRNTASRTTVIPPRPAVSTQPFNPVTGGGAHRAVPITPVTPPSYGSQSSHSSQQPAEEGGGRGKVIAGVLIAIAILAIVAIVFIVRGCSGSTSSTSSSTSSANSGVTASSASDDTPELVAVPDVTNHTTTQALSMLTAAGLSVGTQSNQSSSTVAKGSIISQSPEAGSTVASGSKVNIVISSGEDSVTLPTTSELEGLSEADAVARLQAAGVTPVHDSSLDGYSDTAPSGTFLKIDPDVANMTKVSKGIEVKYGLSWGPYPVTMPDITGWYYSDAEYTLVENGLDYYENWVYDDNVAAGMVIYADYWAGTELSRGTAVGLTISNGSEPVVVPYVTGMSVPDAIAELQNAGFAVGGIYTNYDSTSVVTSVSPSDGSSAPRGSTVTITYTEPTPAEPTTGGDEDNGSGDTGGSDNGSDEGGDGGSEPDNTSPNTNDAGSVTETNGADS